MTEDTIVPLLTHDEPGPRFKAKDIAKVLADRGVPYPTAAARVANYAKSRQIHVRPRAEGAAPNSANFYAIADVAAAVMLSNLQDCGVADQQILSLASETLYAWNVGQRATSYSPILSAAADAWRNEPWALQLDIFRHADTEQREINRAFYRLGDEPAWSQSRLLTDPAWQPVGTILINTGALTSLRRMIAVPKGAH